MSVMCEKVDWVGDYLIDDSEKNGAKEFAGTHIKIHSPEFLDWSSVIRLIFESESIK